MTKKEVKPRNYINAFQREKLLFAIKLYDIMDEIIIDFGKHNTLTKDEMKNLKTSFTYGSKAMHSIIARLNPEARKTLNNSLKSSSVILANEFVRQKYLKQKTTDTQRGYEESKEYYNLCEITMDMNCCNCEKEDIECDLYKHLEENCIVDMEQNLGKCRFAYKAEKDA